MAYTTRVPYSARETSRALAELRDHAFGLRDLISFYRELNVRPARGTKQFMLCPFYMALI